MRRRILVSTLIVVTITVAVLGGPGERELAAAIRRNGRVVLPVLAHATWHLYRRAIPVAPAVA